VHSPDGYNVAGVYGNDAARVNCGAADDRTAYVGAICRRPQKEGKLKQSFPLAEDREMGVL
jgi:hypothetical protein